MDWQATNAEVLPSIWDERPMVTDRWVACAQAPIAGRAGAQFCSALIPCCKYDCGCSLVLCMYLFYCHNQHELLCLTIWIIAPCRSYAANIGGVPLDTMIQLVNQVGAAPWFCMPHLGDNDYIRQFATQVKQQLRPDVNVYVEWSNEVWHTGFPGGCGSCVSAPAFKYLHSACGRCAV